MNEQRQPSIAQKRKCLLIFEAYTGRHWTVPQLDAWLLKHAIGYDAMAEYLAGFDRNCAKQLRLFR